MINTDSKRSRVIMWMTYFILIMTLISTTTISRYIAKVSGSDSVSTANIFLANNVIDLDLNGIAYDASKTFSFQVVNFDEKTNSDVSQQYYIEIKTTNNLPINYTITSQDTNTVDHALNKVDNENRWNGGNMVHSSNVTHNYIVTATWQHGKIDEKYMNEIDAVQLIVHSQQLE